MENKKIGYAVLGLGIGMAHAEAANADENAELVAVCDVDEKRLEKAKALYPNVTCYTDANALFLDPSVDIISICLPSYLHADYAVRAMEAGKHVLIEKPLDVSCERAMAVEQARLRTGMRCGVVLQNRYNFNIAAIKQAVDEGRLGQIFLGTFAVKWYREQSYYDRGGWRGTWEKDGGGSLINQSSHTVDLMQWLMGDVVSVSSSMTVAGHDIEAEDTTVSTLRFANGALATFVSTTCAYPGVSTEVCLYGTKGSVEADADRLRLWKMTEPVADMDEDEEEEMMLERLGGGNRKAAEGRIYGHRFVVSDMIGAVREGRDPQVLPLEGMKSLAVIEAIYRSAKSGETVYPDRG